MREKHSPLHGSTDALLDAGLRLPGDRGPSEFARGSASSADRARSTEPDATPGRMARKVRRGQSPTAALTTEAAVREGEGAQGVGRERGRTTGSGASSNSLLTVGPSRFGL